MKEQTEQVTTEVATSEVTTQETAAAVATPDILGGDAAASTQGAPAAESAAIDNTDFIGTLGDDYKVLATQKGFGNVEDVLKSYSNLEGMMGKKFDEMTNEELAGVYQKLGAPQNLEGYEFERASLPEGMQDEMTDKFAVKAHELGLSVEHAKGLRDWFLKEQTDQYSAAVINAQTQATDGVAELKKEFGAAFDERTSLAATAINEFGGQEVKDLINAYGLGNHPALVKMFAQIGQLTSEGGMAEDRGASRTQFGTTPAEASSKIADKFKDTEFMNRWTQASHPGHADAVREIEQLYKVKNNG